MVADGTDQEVPDAARACASSSRSTPGRASRATAESLRATRALVALHRRRHGSATPSSSPAISPSTAREAADEVARARPDRLASVGPARPAAPLARLVGRAVRLPGARGARRRRRRLGALLLLQRVAEARLFLAAGGFDPDFVFDYEDLDFGWRLGQRGVRLLYEPDAVTRHIHPYDWDAVRRRYESRAAAERLMAAKHSWFDALVPRPDRAGRARAARRAALDAGGRSRARAAGARAARRRAARQPPLPPAPGAPHSAPRGPRRRTASGRRADAHPARGRRLRRPAAERPDALRRRADAGPGRGAGTRCRTCAPAGTTRVSRVHGSSAGPIAACACTS